MKKHQEALSRLRDTDLYYSDDSKFHQDLDVLQELVDKATPIKPIENILGTGKYLITYTHECSKCGNYLEVSNKYCSECATELDWSVEE